MPPLEEIPAFAFRGEQASVHEVLAAAAVRGDLGDPLRLQTWRRACLELAAAEGLRTDQATVEADVSAFRYAHDLISAEETETWLVQRGLDAEQLAEYFATEQWFRALKPRVPAPDAVAVTPDPRQFAPLAAQLFFGGAFGRLAAALAHRLVAGAAATGPAAGDDLRRERRNFLHRTGISETQVAAWLQALGRTPDWLDRRLALEVAFGAFTSSVLTPASLAQALGSARLPFTRVEVERVEFDTLDALREAELAVREDGLTLEQVAQQSLFPFRRHHAYAGDLPDFERETLLFARLGEIVRLNSPSGEFQVARVVLRVEPSLDDPEIRRRLGETIMEAALAEAGGADLHWVI